MGQMRITLLAASRKLLITAAGLSLAGVCVTMTAGPASAQGSSGGTIEHWGSLGTKGKQHDTQLSPVPVNLPRGVVQVASSNSTQYALLNNGQVYAWGLGSNGQLGDNGTTSSLTKAVRVQFPSGVKIAFLPTDVMPYNTGLAVDTTGQAWGWGDNGDGDLCLDNTAEQNLPVKLPFTNVTTLAGGADHATYDGTYNGDDAVWSCGSNQYGELGDGTTDSSDLPVQVIGLPSDSTVSTLVGSWGNTGALLADGQYYDWGYNAAGQIGNGTTGTSALKPVQVPLPDTVMQAAQGGSQGANGQTLVMLSNGTIYAWGSDGSYQLGDGKTANESSPELISPPTGVTYQTLATGGSTSYAISTAGDVYAWGAGAFGQIGDGKTATAPQPVEVESGASLISSTSTDVVVNAPSS
jgi:alpha-tubulin suppressor-like RCC1 family protein